MSLLDSVVRRNEIYKRGHVLFRPGERLDYVYAIRSGSAKTYIGTNDGRVQITGFQIAGELVGLSAFASGQYNCEARTLETTSVCKVAAHEFEELAKTMPSIQYQMLKIMSNQIRHNEKLMLLLGKRNAEERLAEYLLGLSRRFASRNYSATDFNLSMSRGDIGNYLGMSEETVCRIFTRFRDEGLITANRRHIRLNDVRRLSAFAKIHPAA